MSCEGTRDLLPGYLDGALSARAHRRTREHLENCPDCRHELEHYRKISLALGRLEQAAPPPDLANRIRTRVMAARQEESFAARTWRKARLVFENSLEPMAVPATGGLLTAVLVFALVAPSLLVGMPLGAVPNDLPTNLLQPARLESLAPFAVPGITVEGGTSRADILIVEATVSAQGEVVNYRILSGPDDAAVRHQLDQVMMFSRFRPAMNFGRPTTGGRVVLSFSEVRVRG